MELILPAGYHWFGYSNKKIPVASNDRDSCDLPAFLNHLMIGSCKWPSAMLLFFYLRDTFLFPADHFSAFGWVKDCKALGAGGSKQFLIRGNKD